MRRAMSLMVGCALIIGACSSTAAPSTTGAAPNGASTTTGVVVTTSAPGLASMPPAGREASTEVIYFVMTDRFANGDPDNDTGGAEVDDPLVHGYLPTDKGYFHGGDIAGLTAGLDYLEGLGVTAIWMTPPFANRAVQGRGEVGNSSAGYHGYWIVDFETVDSHLGTDEELVAFVGAAHDRGMKVFFDIVTNHTADVISYAETGVSYRSVAFAPYKDAAGAEFEVSEYAGRSVFPELDPAVSFPYTPVYAGEGDGDAKRPAWLNNPVLYHNRGNSTFVGESIQLGDFSGLDDLFTEHPAVVAGLIDVYRNVIATFDIDGFRVDTAKHVNDEFWLEFLPSIMEHAGSTGIDGFFVFGEVSGSDPIFNSRYTDTIGFPSVLDFGFSAAATTFAAGRAGSKVLADHFDDDDWFTDADSDAHSLVTFLGNHDMGRLGSFVRSGRPGAPADELLRRAALGLEVMFFSRGVPTVYYGDEQGFVGDGGDKDARQDMFPSLVESYNDDDLIGTDATTADANFDVDHPLYALIAELAEVRSKHVALQRGAQISRYSQVNRGILAFSRIDRDELIEYLVVLNNDSLGQTASFAVATPETRFDQIYPSGDLAVTSTTEGLVEVSVGPLGAVVLRAERTVPTPAAKPTVSIVRPVPGTVVEFERFRIEAETDAVGFAEVSFWATVGGSEPIFLGTDDAPPFRVFWDSASVASGSEAEVTAVVDSLGFIAEASATFLLGERG